MNGAAVAAPVVLPLLAAAVPANTRTTSQFCRAMRIASSTGSWKIFPSPIWPVCARGLMCRAT